MTFSTVHSTGV